MSIRNLVLFTLLLTLSLFALACQNHDHPIAPQLPASVSLPNSTFNPSIMVPTKPPASYSAPPFGLRPNFAPNAFGDNLAPLAVWPNGRNFCNDEFHSPELTDGLLSTYWATPDTAVSKQCQFVGLQWYNWRIPPVKLSRLFLVNQQFPQYAQSVVSVTYRNVQTGEFEYLPGFSYEEVQLPPEYQSWYPRFWFRDYFTFGGSATSSCDILFPEIETDWLAAWIIPNSKTGENGHPNSRIYISELEAYGPPRKPRVTKIDFLSMTTSDNRNRIYDRKQEYKKTGDKFLEPTQWEGVNDNGEIKQKPGFPHPISYVRSGSTTGSSKIRLKAYFQDLSNSPSLTFTASLTGSISGQPLTFSPQIITTTGGAETTMEFESTNEIPNTVGTWELVLNWSFFVNGTSCGTQRTPDSGFQTVYTTWAKPKADGYFEHDVINSANGKPRVEGKAALYLEIIRYSCQFATGTNSLNDERSLTSQLLNNCWSNASSLGFVYKAGINPKIFVRGIDAILEPPHEGVCQDWAYFFKALNHSQGGNIWFRGATLAFADYNAGLRLWDKTSSKTLVGLGGVVQTPKSLWFFASHAWNSFNFNDVVDISFNRQNSSEENHINGLFDLYNLTNGQTTPDPFSILSIFMSNQ